MTPNVRRRGAQALKAYEKAKAQWERVGAEYGFGPSPQMTRAGKAYEKARVRLRTLAAKAEGTVYHPPRKNPTKAQKREKAKKAAGKRRIAEALKKFVQKANPAAKGVVKATKVKGGWNVRVIKLNPKSLTELEADGRRILGFAPKKKSTGGRYSAYTSEAALQKALAKSKRGRK